MVRGVTIAQSSPTCNHLNKRMNPWLIRNAIVMLLERTLSLHLSPHISKNYSWYTESPLKLFLCICQSFSIEILLFQFLKGSLKITFNLLSSTQRRPTPLVFVLLSPLHPDGRSLRKWVKHEDMDDMEQFYKWDEKYLAIGELSTSFFENSWDKGNPEFLKTNPIKNLHMILHEFQL